MLRNRIASLSVMAALLGVPVYAQVVIDQKEFKFSKSSTHVDLCQNNGRILSNSGLEKIQGKDVVSIRVGKDTIYYLLREDFMKKLDLDPKNYEPSVKKDVKDRNNKQDKKRKK